MDASHIMAGTLIGAAVVFLVWAELRSRRNIRHEKAEQSGEPASEPEARSA